MAPTALAMQALMAPRSVAVVGATERTDASSSFVMRNLIAQGFRGEVMPVNPRGGTVFGRVAAPSLKALDRPADVAVIGIAADRVNAALEEAAACGIRAAVVLASGFGETDEAGKARQAELVAIAARNGMAICGPNCLGLFNLSTGAALYSSRLSVPMQRGRLALVSHSGASAIALGNTGRLGLSHIVSCGNAAATDLPDYLAWLAEDPETEVVGLVVEAIRDPSAFAAAMEAVHRAGKSVVALRAGRSSTGARATAAHTGALAGANEAFASFFRRTGVIEAADMDGLIATATLCLGLKGRPPAGGVAVTGVSGGGVAHVCDIAEENGIALPDFAAETTNRLKALLPSFATPQNPLDTTGVVFADATIYSRVLETIAADPAVGMIVMAQDAPAGLDAEGAAEYAGIADAARRFAQANSTPLVFMSNLSSGHHPAVRAAADGAIVMDGTAATLSAIRAVTTAPAPGRLSGMSAGEAEPAWLARLAGPTLTEREVKAWLAANGLPVTREQLATSPEDAAHTAETIGFPVVMKIESPDIDHKTEAGGVRLGIADALGARAAYKEIMDNAAAYAPGADLRGVVVQEMVQGGVEVLVGLVRHEPFGLGLVVGVGGVLVELVKDTAFELLPVDRDLAEVMIDRTALGELLAGFRGRRPADRAALVDLIVGVSAFGERYGARLDALDLNPVAVLGDGCGARILDALAVARSI
jgi:acyl-CoA synthetase (NDP forming)